jgi:outer membrane protein OmpA-like peptidoglycan-associated protein
VRRLELVTIAMFAGSGCGGSPSAEPGAGPGEQTSAGQESSAESPREDEFQIRESDTAEQAHGERPSQIEATETHAAMRLFVVNPDSGPIPGIVIKMTAPDGTTYFTGETDSHGYAEVLVPIGRRYEMEYLSLGRRHTTATVNVPPERNQDLRLTMRYRRLDEPRLVLEDVLFANNSATLQEESFPRLDRVVEYMRYKPNARIRVSGHTDNVGNARRNRTLSQARAESVREYLVDHGVDAARVEAVGYGDEQPVATNDTEEGRAQNRRIEATEL